MTTILGLPWFSKAERALFNELDYACVYAIGPGAAGPIKVTWGAKLPEKLAELQAGSWLPLAFHEVAWTMGPPLAMRLKGEIHRRLDARGLRLQGDWFAVSVDEILPVYQQATDALGLKTWTHAQMVQHVHELRERRLRKEVASLSGSVPA